MADITSRLILDGITLALREAFPNAQITSDRIEQGLTEPAFVVLMVTNEQSELPNMRYRRTPRYDIIYFPENGREDCYSVADTLWGALEVVTLPNGDSVRGSSISVEITDDVLHVLVNYNHNTYKTVDEVDMEELTFIQEG